MGYVARARSVWHDVTEYGQRVGNLPFSKALPLLVQVTHARWSKSQEPAPSHLWHFRSCSSREAAVCMFLLPMRGIIHSDMPFPSAFPELMASRLFCSLGTGAKSQKAPRSVWIPHCGFPLCEAVLSSCSPTATGDDIVCYLLAYRTILHIREKKIFPWVNLLMPVGHFGGTLGSIVSQCSESKIQA